MSSLTWDEPALQELLGSTRRSMFDFNKVAGDMNAFLSSRGEHMVTLSSEDCRLAYAANFLPSPSTDSADQVVDDEDEEKLAEINVDEMSFDEIMKVLQYRQDQNDRKKEKIFNRVLQSLGTSSESEVFHESPALSAMRVNILERKRQKEADAAMAVERARAREERQWIERERERLRKRHDPSSEDAQGIDPASSAPKAVVEDEIDRLELPYANFNIEDLLANEKFNALLEEIEKDFESRADEKGTGEASELSEVLALLDKAAAESKKKSKASSALLSKDTKSPAKAQSPPSYQSNAYQAASSSYISREDIGSENDFASQEKEKITAVPLGHATAAAGGGGASSSYGNNAARVPAREGGGESKQYAHGTNSDAASAEVFRGSNSAPNNRGESTADYGSSGLPSYSPAQRSEAASSANALPPPPNKKVTAQATATENTSAPAAGPPNGEENESSPHSDDESEEEVDSDDEDDWRATRAKLKAAASQYETRKVSVPVPSSSSASAVASASNNTGPKLAVGELEESETQSPSKRNVPSSALSSQQPSPSSATIGTEVDSPTKLGMLLQHAELSPAVEEGPVAENVLSGSLLGRGRSKAGDQKKSLIRKL